MKTKNKSASVQLSTLIQGLKGDWESHRKEMVEIEKTLLGVGIEMGGRKTAIAKKSSKREYVKNKVNHKDFMLNFVVAHPASSSKQLRKKWDSTARPATSYASTLCGLVREKKIERYEKIGVKGLLLRLVSRKK